MSPPSSHGHLYRLNALRPLAFNASRAPVSSSDRTWRSAPLTTGGLLGGEAASSVGAPAECSPTPGKGGHWVRMAPPCRWPRASRLWPQSTSRSSCQSCDHRRRKKSPSRRRQANPIIIERLTPAWRRSGSAIAQKCSSPGVYPWPSLTRSRSLRQGVRVHSPARRARGLDPRRRRRGGTGSSPNHRRAHPPSVPSARDGPGATWYLR